MSSPSNPPQEEFYYEDERAKRLPAPTKAWIRPQDLGPLFAERPRILGEDKQLYEDVLSQAAAAVKPADFIEALWVKEAVDLVWDALYYRRVKQSFMVAAQKDALKRLTRLADTVIAQWEVQDKTAVASVEKVLKARGLTMEAVIAEIVVSKFDKIEQLDRIIATADARRDKALGQIERRRDALARQLRRFTNDITLGAPPMHR